MPLFHWLRWLEDPLDAPEPERRAKMAESTIADGFAEFYCDLLAKGVPSELAARLTEAFCDTTMDILLFSRQHEICAGHAHNPDDGPTTLPDIYYKD